MRDNGHKMTAAEAVQFDRHSVANAAILEQAAADRGCACAPYADWFTYNRWAAQGMQVQRDEHGVRLATFVLVKARDEATGETKVVGKRPHWYSAFCRCQVKPKEA